MNYQRRYIERLAERILAFLVRPEKKGSFKALWAWVKVPGEFTKRDLAAALKVCEANVAEALGLLRASGRIERVKVGCRAFGPAVYRRA